MSAEEMYRVFYRASYVILLLSPVYAIAAVILGQRGVPAPIVLAPVFLLVAPAGAYLASLKCPHCKNVIYTRDRVSRKPNGSKAWVPPFYETCPVCKEKL